MSRDRLIVIVVLTLVFGLLLGPYLPALTHPTMTLVLLLVVCGCGCGASYFSMSPLDREKPYPYLFICVAFLGSNFATVKSSFEQLVAERELVIKIKDANSNRYLGFVGKSDIDDGRFIGFVAPGRARIFSMKRTDGGGIHSGDEVEIYVYTSKDRKKCQVIYPDADNSLQRKPGYRLQCRNYSSSQVPGISPGYDTSVIYYRSPDSKDEVTLVPIWGERQGVWASLNESKDIPADGAYGLTFIQDSSGFKRDSRLPSKFVFEFQGVKAPSPDELKTVDAADTPTPTALLIPNTQCSLAWNLKDGVVYLEGEDATKAIGPKTQGFGEWQSSDFTDWGSKRPPLSILHNGNKAFFSRHRVLNGFGFSNYRGGITNLPKANVVSASVNPTWDLASEKVVLCYQPEPAPAGRFIFYTSAPGGFSTELSGRDRSD